MEIADAGLIQPVHRPVAGSDSVKASLRLPFQSLESKPY